MWLYVCVCWGVEGGIWEPLLWLASELGIWGGGTRGRPGFSSSTLSWPKDNLSTLREVPETAGGDWSVFQDYMLALC